MKSEWMARMRERMGALGPYLLIELLLPGGSLVAAALWLTQRLRRAGASRRDAPAGPNAAPAVEDAVPSVCACPPLPIAAPEAAAVA